MDRISTNIQEILANQEHFCAEDGEPIYHISTLDAITNFLHKHNKIHICSMRRLNDDNEFLYRCHYTYWSEDGKTTLNLLITE